MKIDEKKLIATRMIKCDKCGHDFNVALKYDATIGIDKGLDVDVYHMCPLCTKNILGFLLKRSLNEEDN